MKKVICFLGALLLVMTGCTTKSQSTETSKSSTTTSIEKSETVTSEAKEETKVLTAEINGNQHRYTITTKGDKVQKLKLDVLSALPEKIATNSANLSPEEMTKIINEGLQSDSEYKALKDTAGFSIEYKVTPEKKLASTVSVDMETIDWDKVKDLSYFKDLGIGDLKDIKASTVFTGLKLHGFKEETPAPQVRTLVRPFFIFHDICHVSQ